MPIVLKSGRLNLLELSGPVQACNGIALPVPLLFNDAAYSSGYIRRMVGLLANNELERIWKEAILV